MTSKVERITEGIDGINLKEKIKENCVEQEQWQSGIRLLKITVKNSLKGIKTKKNQEV